MALPRQATQPLTPTMRRQIRLQRQMEGPQRMETRPEFRPLAKPEVAPQGPERVPQAPARGIQPSPGRAVQPSHVAPPGHFQPEPSRELHTTPRREVPARTVPGTSSACRRRVPSGASQGSIARPSAGGFRPTMPREFRASPPPVFRSAPRPAPPAPRLPGQSARAPGPGTGPIGSLWRRRGADIDSLIPPLASQY